MTICGWGHKDRDITDGDITDGANNGGIRFKEIASEDINDGGITDGASKIKVSKPKAGAPLMCRSKRAR